jgi:dihydropteroate synthase
MTSSRESQHWCFVTGRLAEHALRTIAAQVASQHSLCYHIEVLPITVAALMSPAWVAKHLELPEQTTHLLLPGYCAGDLAPLVEKFPQIVIERGPRDVRRLPEFFGGTLQRDASYGAYDIEILAEINHAPRMKSSEILALAQHYRASGADCIDLGCVPGERWSGVSDCVRMLRNEGLRVSIDSFDPQEIAPAVRAGAELVLSVNSTNRAAAVDWGCEVVVIPDDFATLAGLEETLEFLSLRKIPLRLDPILEPIGCGFAASLQRYSEVRRRYPDAEIMMGIGNLTELTDVDSAGVNVLLLGICQELGIRSVLTTEVINWSKSSVRECDLARRLVHYAVVHRIPPKHLAPELILLRDEKIPEFEPSFFDALAGQLKDHNYRIFAEQEQLHLVAAGLHLSDNEPFRLFEKLVQPSDGRKPPTNIDPAHAFYLGYELAKAQVALTLSKEYRQDESLNWGYLTREERTHRVKLSSSGSQTALEKEES